MSRGLVFLLLAHRNDDQDDDRDDVGQHLHKVGDVAGHRDAEQRRQKLVQPIEHTEQVRAPDGVQRLPGRENDQRHGQPAQRLDLAGGRPDALVVVQYIVQAADAADACADAGGQVLVQRNVDARSVRGGGVLTDGAQIQARTGAGQEPVQHHSQQDRRIDEKTVGEHDLPDVAQTRQHGNFGAERLVGDGSGGVAGAVQDKHAEEVCHTHAEGRQRQTGDVLVGAQGDGQERIDQAARHRGQNSTGQGDQDADKAVGVGSAVLIGPGAGKARETAQVHDARHAEVQVAGFLGHGLAQRTVHDNCAKRDGAHDPRNQTAVHITCPPCVRRGG